MLVGKVEECAREEENVAYKGVGMYLAGMVRVKEIREDGAHDATQSSEDEVSFEVSPKVNFHARAGWL